MNVHSRTGTAIQPLRERVKQLTRDAILLAAEAVFAERGFNGARMDEIAKRAGVAVGTLYNHFDDRRAILDAVLDALAQELRARLAADLPPPTAPFPARLERFLRLTVEQIDAHFRVYAMLAEEELEYGRARRARAPMLRILFDVAQELVGVAVHRGELRAEDSALYPALLVGMIRGVFMRKLLRGSGLPLASYVKPMARFFREGAGRAAS
jgi:AcrR family transcriptional regulator